MTSNFIETAAPEALVMGGAAIVGNAVENVAGITAAATMAAVHREQRSGGADSAWASTALTTPFAPFVPGTMPLVAAALPRARKALIRYA